MFLRHLASFSPVRNSGVSFIYVACFPKLSGIDIPSRHSHSTHFKPKTEETCHRFALLAEMSQVETILFLIFVIGMCVYGQEAASKIVSDRYAVHWNRTNPR